jgi:hypothetical protein
MQESSWGVERVLCMGVNLGREWGALAGGDGWRLCDGGTARAPASASSSRALGHKTSRPLLRDPPHTATDDADFSPSIQSSAKRHPTFHRAQNTEAKKGCPLLLHHETNARVLLLGPPPSPARVRELRA